jgi:histidine phosphotransfer protein HptB
MIDWKRVEDLKEEIGLEGFVEVVDMFLDEE